MVLKIKNKNVEQYRNYLIKLFNDGTIDRSTRKQIGKRIKLVELLVSIYEYGENIDIDDFMWNEIGDPLLPEEKEQLLKSIT